MFLLLAVFSAITFWKILIFSSERSTSFHGQYLVSDGFKMLFYGGVLVPILVFLICLSEIQKLDTTVPAHLASAVAFLTLVLLFAEARSLSAPLMFGDAFGPEDYLTANELHESAPFGVPLLVERRWVAQILGILAFTWWPLQTLHSKNRQALTKALHSDAATHDTIS